MRLSSNTDRLDIEVSASLSVEMLASARKRLLRMHYESGVGHIGGNLSSLDALLVLFHECLEEHDEFVLSKGHGAGALYVALWSRGLLREEDLETFHKDNTRLPGHPPASGLPLTRFATGSLGHGLSLAAGFALGAKLQRQDSHAYCLTSDGEWQEGSTWEAFIFACHHKLNNLTILVDHNGLQGFGSTADVASMSPLWERVKGFPVEPVIVDGHDTTALKQALLARKDGPNLVFMTTTKGARVSFMEHRMEWHYLPLNEQQYQQAIRDIDLP
jgi:transketolase